MNIDNPVVAEITALLDRYDRAIATNDLDALDEMFWRSDKTLRYAANGNPTAMPRFRLFAAAATSRASSVRAGRTVIKTSARISPPPTPSTAAPNCAK